MNKKENGNEFQFSTIEEAIEDLRRGRLILCTDDPDRENEGDFICAGQYATTENINFMAVPGKGLICMPVGEEVTRRLNLTQMVGLFVEPQLSWRIPTNNDVLQTYRTRYPCMFSVSAGVRINLEKDSVK